MLLIFQLISTWRTSARCWHLDVLIAFSPRRSAIVVFMKNWVFHQSPQYITSLAMEGSLKQSFSRTLAKPLGIILFPPRIDITVDLHAPLAPTTRMRAPRLKEKDMSFRHGESPAA